jgi:ParB/RepB/Spo0J family partition protein
MTPLETGSDVASAQTLDRPAPPIPDSPSNGAGGNGVDDLATQWGGRLDFALKERRTLPTQGREPLDLGKLNDPDTIEDEAVNADVFEKRDRETREVLLDGTGRFLKMPTITEHAYLVPLDLIDSNPRQPRKKFAEKPMRELETSLVKGGQDTPITVVPYRNADGEIRLALNDGERRWRAHVNLGATHIAVILRWTPTNDDFYKLSGRSNLHREGHTPIEYGEFFAELRASAPQDQEGGDKFLSYIRGETGHTQSFIEKHLALLDLESGVQDLVHEGILSVPQAFALRDAAKGSKGRAHQTQLAYVVLRVEEGTPADQIKKAPRHSKLSAEHFAQGVISIIRGVALTDVDDRQIAARRRIRAFGDNAKGVTRNSQRLVDLLEEDPALVAAALSTIGGGDVQLRRRIRRARAGLASLLEALDEVANPVLALPYIPGKPLFADYVVECQAALKTGRSTRPSAIKSAELQYRLAVELAQASDEGDTNLTAADLATLLNQRYDPEKRYTSSNLASALSALPKRLKSSGLELDRVDRHVETDGGELDFKTAYRLAWPEQIAMLRQLREVIGSEGTDIDALPDVDVAPEQRRLPAQIMQIFMHNIAHELLPQLGISRTDYSRQLMQFLLLKGEGNGEEDASTSSELYDFRGGKDEASRVTASQSFGRQLERLAREEIIELIPGKPRRFWLKKGQLPDLEPKRLEMVLKRTAKQAVAKLGATIDEADLLKRLQTLRGVSTVNLRAGIQKMIAESSVAAETVERAKAAERIVLSPANQVRKALSAEISKALLSNVITSSGRRGFGGKYNQTLMACALLSEEGEAQSSEEFYEFYGRSSDKKTKTAIGVGFWNSIRKLAENGLIAFEVHGKKTHFTLQRDALPEIDVRDLRQAIRTAFLPVQEYFGSKADRALKSLLTAAANGSVFKVLEAVDGLGLTDDTPERVTPIAALPTTPRPRTARTAPSTGMRPIPLEGAAPAPRRAPTATPRPAAATRPTTPRPRRATPPAPPAQESEAARAAVQEAEQEAARERTARLEAAAEAKRTEALQRLTQLRPEGTVTATDYVANLNRLRALAGSIGDDWETVVAGADLPEGPFEVTVTQGEGMDTLTVVFNAEDGTFTTESQIAREAAQRAAEEAQRVREERAQLIEVAKHNYQTLTQSDSLPLDEFQTLIEALNETLHSMDSGARMDWLRAANVSTKPLSVEIQTDPSDETVIESYELQFYQGSWSFKSLSITERQQSEEAALRRERTQDADGQYKYLHTDNAPREVRYRALLVKLSGILNSMDDAERAAWMATHPDFPTEPFTIELEEDDYQVTYHPETRKFTLRSQEDIEASQLTQAIDHSLQILLGGQAKTIDADAYLDALPKLQEALGELSLDDRDAWAKRNNLVGTQQMVTVDGDSYTMDYHPVEHAFRMISTTEYVEPYPAPGINKDAITAYCNQNHISATRRIVFLAIVKAGDTGYLPPMHHMPSARQLKSHNSIQQRGDRYYLSSTLMGQFCSQSFEEGDATAQNSEHKIHNLKGQLSRISPAALRRDPKLLPLMHVPVKLFAKSYQPAEYRTPRERGKSNPTPDEQRYEAAITACFGREPRSINSNDLLLITPGTSGKPEYLIIRKASPADFIPWPNARTSTHTEETAPTDELQNKVPSCLAPFLEALKGAKNPSNVRTWFKSIEEELNKLSIPTRDAWANANGFEGRSRLTLSFSGKRDRFIIFYDHRKHQFMKREQLI